MPILLLTVRGRRTDRPRTAPVGFLSHDGAWIVAGSAGGMDAEPQWFQNLRKTDQAIAEIGNVRRDVAVTVTEGRQRDALWHLLLTAYPFFAEYQNKAAREIPVAVLKERK
jgi:deazaflavin-dependent oxidoreductase (nitroreductase family)